VASGFGASRAYKIHIYIHEQNILGTVGKTAVRATREHNAMRRAASMLQEQNSSLRKSQETLQVAAGFV
jgi:hypothetical protein